MKSITIDKVSEAADATDAWVAHFSRWTLPALLLASLTLLFAIVNGYWLRVNEVTYGWDRMDHLITSLSYNNILRELSPHTFFEALAWSDYYPPLVHIVSVLGYKLFGVHEDVAALTNLLYFALLVAAVWSIGERAGGRRVAILASLMIATFPMIFTMSRYLYLDFALTCLVAASMAALLATDRFSRRTPALLFGLFLGLSFLVKWTAAAFIAAPLLLLLWRSGAIRYLLRHPAALRPAPRRFLASLVLGELLVALWLLPAYDIVAQQPLRGSLIPLLGLLLAGVLYALPFWEGRQVEVSEAHRALRNALRAGVVAAFTLSLWYLTNLNFLQGFYINAYGKPTGRTWAYGKYLFYVFTEQLGPFYFVLFVLVFLGALFTWFLRARRWPLALDDTSLLLLLWAVVPVVIFSTRVSTVHSRYLMPFLPPFALWLALGLWRLRPTAFRFPAIVLVLFLAWGQFAILSFDQLAGWRDRFAIGSTNLLAHGFSIQFPTVGVTDPDFAIAPDVLAVVDEQRQKRGQERAALGLLVNSYQVHEKHFLYQLYVAFPYIDLRELARNWSDRPAYQQLFEMDYVLVSDTHSYRTAEQSQEVARRILGEPDDLFRRAFQEVQRWELPSGEKIYLYERRFPATEPGLVPETYQHLVGSLVPELREGDALLLNAPDQAYILGMLLPEDAPVAVLPLPAVGAGEEEPLAVLAEAARAYRRLFLLNRNSISTDPEGQIERWLHTNTFPAAEWWVEDVRIAPFVPVEPASGAQEEIGVAFGNDAITLQGVTWARPEAQALRAGDALPFTLFWSAPMSTDVKVSLQLASEEGVLLVQRDVPLVDGAQRHALLMPRDAVAGTYQLNVVLYHGESLERLPLTDGREVLEVERIHLLPAE